MPTEQIEEAILTEITGVEAGSNPGDLKDRQFNEDPQHVLLVGLGGGSLSKHCHHQLPRAHIATLRISQDVIALRNEFMVTRNDEHVPRYRALLQAALH